MSRLYKTTVLGLILFSVLSLFMSIPPEWNYRTAADEGTYYFYATSVSKYGLSMIPEIGKAFVKSERLRLQPNPLRVGHILATASWYRVFPQTYVSLARFSFVCFVLFLAASFFFSRKLLGEDVAYIFTLLLSSSPLLMAMGRRALSDMHANLFCGLAIWLFLCFLRDRKHTVYALFLLAFTLAILARESSLVAWPFFVLGLLAWKYIYRNDVPLPYLAGIILIPAVIIGVAYIFLFGGISVSIGLFKTLFITHADPAKQISPYALAFCSGPWFRYLIDFVVLSPLTMLLFIAYTGYRIMAKNIDWQFAYFLGYFLLIYAFFSCLKESKVVRFVISLDMVITLFAALGLWEFFRFKRAEMRVHFVLVSAVAIFFINYLNFIETFYVRDVYDPVTYNLLSVQKMVPRLNR